MLAIIIKLVENHKKLSRNNSRKRLILEESVINLRKALDQLCYMVQHLIKRHLIDTTLDRTIFDRKALDRNES